MYLEQRGNTNTGKAASKAGAYGGSELGSMLGGAVGPPIIGNVIGNIVGEKVGEKAIKDTGSSFVLNVFGIYRHRNGINLVFRQKRLVKNRRRKRVPFPSNF